MTEGTVTQFAQADDDGVSTHQKHGLTIVSKWQGSFDESLDDDQNDGVAAEPLPVEKLQSHTNLAASVEKIRPMPTDAGAKVALSPLKSALKHTNSADSSQQMIAAGVLRGQTALASGPTTKSVPSNLQRSGSLQQQSLLQASTAASVSSTTPTKPLPAIVVSMETPKKLVLDAKKPSEPSKTVQNFTQSDAQALKKRTADAPTIGSNNNSDSRGFFSHFKSIRASFQDLLPAKSPNLEANRKNSSASVVGDTAAPASGSPSSKFSPRFGAKKSEKSTDSGVSSAGKSNLIEHADQQVRKSQETTTTTNVVESPKMAGVPTKEDEKELRRQRRYRRRSDCDSFRELAQKMTGSGESVDAQAPASGALGTPRSTDSSTPTSAAQNAVVLNVNGAVRPVTPSPKMCLLDKDNNNAGSSSTYHSRYSTPTSNGGKNISYAVQPPIMGESRVVTPKDAGSYQKTIGNVSSSFINGVLNDRHNKASSVEPAYHNGQDSEKQPAPPPYSTKVPLLPSR